MEEEKEVLKRDKKKAKNKLILFWILGFFSVIFLSSFVFLYVGMFMGFVEPMYLFAFIFGILPLYVIAAFIGLIVFVIIRFLIPFIKKKMKNKN